MVITRKSLLLTLFVLSLCLATLSFALNTVLAEEDVSVETYCVKIAEDQIRYWCGPDNKYYEGTYDVYWCEPGREEWRMKSQKIVSDFCPY